MAAGAMGVAAMGVLGGCAESGAAAAAAPAAAAAAEALYKPGTYTAAAKGIASDVKVTMTFSETAITDCKIDVSGETKDIGGKIGPAMEKAVLDAHSPDVDAVTGGWIAAMTAAEEGAKVLVVEKAETPTKIKEDIGAIDSRLQKESFAQFPEFKIDKTEALLEIVRYASGYADSDLVKVWIDNSAETVDWLTDILEGTGHWFMQFEGGVGNLDYPDHTKAFATGHSPHPTADKPQDVDLNSDMRAFVEERGGTIRCNTSLVKLEQMSDGKVTGIIAQDTQDNHYIRIKASKGVIMATGGYASNGAMMLALQPQTMKMKINVPMGSKSDGAGIKAMLWAGGQMDPCHASMMFNRCSCLPTETAGYQTNGKWYWFGEQPFLKVNLKGKRFCNESGPYEFMLHSMYMQPDHTYVDVFDSNCKKYAEQFDEVGCCRLFPFPNGAISNRDFDTCWRDMTEGDNSHLALGYLQKADTLEELAEKLNIPVDAFKESVWRYNTFCAKGVDEDYGKPAHRLTPVDTPPFYGIRTGAWHLTTLDGVRINTNMQVIREDGSVIEGLYATGDCTGGIFANNYPNLFTGLACGRTMTFGRRAAKMVCAKR